MFTALYIDFSRHARAGNSVVSGRIWLKFELIKVLVAYKNEEDQNKNEGTSVPIASLWGIFQTFKGMLKSG